MRFQAIFHSEETPEFVYLHPICSLRHHLVGKPLHMSPLPLHAISYLGPHLCLMQSPKSHHIPSCPHCLQHRSLLPRCSHAPDLPTRFAPILLSADGPRSSSDLPPLESHPIGYLERQNRLCFTMYPLPTSDNAILLNGCLST